MIDAVGGGGGDGQDEQGRDDVVSRYWGVGWRGGCDICYKSLLKCNWAGGEKEMRDLVR